MKALSKKELEQRRKAAKAHEKWLRESRYDEAMEKLREEWLFLLHNARPKDSEGEVYDE
ncbi:MAG: hypothetical protein SO088_04565 [Ruminococcus callidus]|nr:hypothetical protein [Ruminococcus callidus]